MTPSVSKPGIDGGVPLLEGSTDRARLGFGCAGLLQLPLRGQRQRLLAAAYDAGLRHFDLARMYGLGMAEAEVGRFARGREGVTIATKFGIEPPAPAMARLQAPARAAIAALPALREKLKGGGEGGGERPPRRYDAAGARRSLETSLRALGAERVDLFLVHDPGPGDEVDAEGIAELCERLRDEGKVGAWGISGDPDPCLELAPRLGPEAVLQVRDGIFDPAPVPAALAPAITFGVLGAAVGRIAAHLAEPGRRAAWSEEVGLDCGRPEVLASLLLQDALARNEEGGVLFATTRPVRLRAALASAAAVARDPEPPPLAAFRRRVAAELASPGADGG